MKIKLLTSVFVLVAIFNCFAQNEPLILRSKGNIPSELLITLEEKLDNQVISSSIYRPREERLSEIDFYKKSNFWITDLLKSGRLLYGDETSKYVNEVLDKLLEKNPSLRKQISVYVVKSSSLNAFATDQGIIVVNMGLLARIESEAQLAMVLAHEITHFIKKHNVSGHLENFKIENGPKSAKKSSFEKILNKHHYSQELETEADDLGFETYLKTNYKVSEAITIFDLLNNSGEPIFNDDLTAQLKEKSLWVNESKEVIRWKKAFTDLDTKDTSSHNDELSTHPNSLVRKERIESNISKKGISKDKGKAFLVDEERFNAVKKQAQLEMPRLLLLNNQTEEAIYTSLSFIDRDIYPEYFKVIIGKSLLKTVSLINNFEYNNHKHIYNGENQSLAKIYRYMASNTQENLDSTTLSYINQINNEINSEETKSLLKFAQGKLDSDKKNSVIHQTSYKTTAVVSPKIIYADFRKDPFVLQYLEENEFKNDLIESLKENKNVQVFDGNLLTETNPDLYHEMNTLNNYLAESMAYEDNVFPTDFYEVEKIRNKYKLEKLLMPVALHAKELRKMSGFTAYFWVAFFPPALPIIIARAFDPIKNSFYAFFEIDLNSYTYSQSEVAQKSGLNDKRFIEKLTTQVAENE